MPDSTFDFAVFGSNVFSCLLAGLLATEHGKRTCLVGSPWSPLHLPRRFDLSVMPATRPETWALLQAGVPETLKLLTSMGKGLHERVDPVFLAERPGTADMLSHMRHVAAGLGVAAEPVVEPALVQIGSGCRIRDAVLLVPGRIEEAMAAWLEKCDVRRLRVSETRVTLRRGGGAQIVHDAATLEALHAVLADDAAILGMLDSNGRGSTLKVQEVTSVLTEPAGALPVPVIHYLDRQVMLVQSGGRGPVQAIASGAAEVLPRIGSCLASRTPLLRAGQTVHLQLSTSDGAPLVGSVPGTRAIVLAGLGPGAAFLAGALARYLAGNATDAERSFFAARAPARGKSRQEVADWSFEPLPELAV